ncbi:TPA: MIP/aquaporin family protein [Haemophilus influenzae]|uniref:MIP/aquaporin family protein n=1 Tax=Haemophilus influenzae TaxID=727 RepID=UPI002DD44C39|nr:MIP/aquaporin family protein [Haemophilus influenzae]
MGTAFFYGVRTWRLCQYFLKKIRNVWERWFTYRLWFGLSMVSIAVIFGPLSGAHVNPAVTIDFWEVGKFPTELVLVYIIAQCIGAFIVALIVWLLFKDHLDEEDNQNCQLGSFATIAANSNNLRNLLSEIVTTFSLLFILFTLNHQQPTNGVAMFFVFTGVAGGVMSFGGLTSYAINPARDFMLRLIHAIMPIKNKGTSNFDYAWVPVLRPVIGAILAAWLYKALF